MAANSQRVPGGTRLRRVAAGVPPAAGVRSEDVSGHKRVVAVASASGEGAARLICRHALCRAIRWGRRDTVEYLLAAGADVARVPMHLVRSSVIRARDYEMLRLLSTHGLFTHLCSGCTDLSDLPCEEFEFVRERTPGTHAVVLERGRVLRVRASEVNLVAPAGWAGRRRAEKAEWALRTRLREDLAALARVTEVLRQHIGDSGVFYTLDEHFAYVVLYSLVLRAQQAALAASLERAPPT